MITQENLKNGRIKAIPRNLLGLIVVYEGNDFELGRKILNDDSFDIAYVNTADVALMKANFNKINFQIPLHKSYCGHAITKIVSELSYGKKIEFTSSIRLKELYKKMFSSK